MKLGGKRELLASRSQRKYSLRGGRKSLSSLSWEGNESHYIRKEKGTPSDHVHASGRRKEVGAPPSPEKSDQGSNGTETTCQNKTSRNAREKKGQ